MLTEIDQLIAQGVRYLYFIDEIFLPQRRYWKLWSQRDVVFGVQTRIDLWKPDMLRLLGEAGCVSIEAGIESLTAEGREALAKRCRLETEDLANLLFTARRHVPFVQGNLIGVDQDDPELVKYWRERLIDQGVWANAPVPMYPYPSSPRLPGDVGRTRRSGLGARARVLPGAHSRVQRHPGRAPVTVGSFWRRNLPAR